MSRKSNLQQATALESEENPYRGFARMHADQVVGSFQGTTLEVAEEVLRERQVSGHGLDGVLFEKCHSERSEESALRF